MPRCSPLLPPLLAALVGALSAAEPADLKLAPTPESRAEYDRSVAPFLAQHCAAYHGPQKAEGDLDPTALPPDMKATTSGARWAQVVEKLAAGEMPPKGRPRPAADELVAVGRWAHAEAKRAGRNFACRTANGNVVPPLDGGRPLSSEI